MQFDDRLATVLRMRTASATGERTQFRQLLDLLGTASARDHSEAGYARLAELRASIPQDEQATILREAGLRLRNPQLVEFLADGAAKPAASAIATARLSDAEWQVLIPRLPVTARGFLRHRRDLPPGALRQLEQLGVGDLVLSDERVGVRPFADAKLPAPKAVEQVSQRIAARPPRVAPPPAPSPAPSAARTSQPIGDLIERIEQFRTARRVPVLAPRLPLGDLAPVEATRIDAFDMVTDAQGCAVWASAQVAPLIVGMALTGALVRMEPTAVADLRQQQPIQSRLLHLSGAPAIAGDWRIDAAPMFGLRGGFAGYRCRLLRAVPAEGRADPEDSHADRMRQVLHELRTPVNAIQGFAEIIQQQLFGPVPHEYRAHAAGIAVDAARLLAGFEEIDRLAKLESGAAMLDPGEADLQAVVEDTLHRLEGPLAARHAGFDLAIWGGPFTIPVAHSEAMALCWRILASAAAALAARERVPLRLCGDDSVIKLELDLPAALHDPSAVPRRRKGAAVSAGMFGPQFAFRLATAEAQAAGGSLAFNDLSIALTLPVLPASGNLQSTIRERLGG